MRVVVIEPPKPIVKPEQVPGNHATDDALVTAMIAAAQAEIDGPSGWLGRALGEQTLEAHLYGFDEPLIALPCRPIIKVESVEYEDAGGVMQTLLPVEYELVGDSVVMKFGKSWPPVRFYLFNRREPVRIRYRAGYDGATTGKVPANAVAAIILMTQELLAQAKADGGLRSVTVDDVITQAFNSPDMVQRARTVAVERLLAPLRVYVL